jgi:23S rRNA (pseudouridine1915-N3)-methyltransferase
MVLLNLATANESWAAQAQELYVNKINHFDKFEIKSLKPKKADRDSKEIKVKKESELILENLSKDDFVILFDERGKAQNSIDFSKLIERSGVSGKKRLVFIIGGAFGVSDDVRTRAEAIVSFSNMVFNHLVAQTVALEQIYRAHTILKGIPYHNL